MDGNPSCHHTLILHPPEPRGFRRHILRLKELFTTLPDARIIGRVLHSLPEVLLVALCAMVSDCEDFTDMGHFARSQLDWLRQFIPLRNGPPSHDVFRNVFEGLCDSPWMKRTSVAAGRQTAR